MKKGFLFFVIMVFMWGCENASRSIVTGVDEREANIIVVFLESKGINAYKERSSSGSEVGGGSSIPKFNIVVDNEEAITAMAILNSNGLPRKQGTNLLELFAKEGLMTTDKEETIRYHSGLASQITNMILMIDGVIDATVQLSFPEQSASAAPGEGEQQKVTASVFVKHQGIIDDPNSHLEMKIKRLVSGSVGGLEMDDVTIISDRSRLTDIRLNEVEEQLGRAPSEYVKIWSITMSKESASKFRLIFSLLLFLAILLAICIGWIFWKIYPIVRSNGGVSELLSPAPFFKKMRADRKAQKEVSEEE